MWLPCPKTNQLLGAEAPDLLSDLAQRGLGLLLEINCMFLFMEAVSSPSSLQTELLASSFVAIRI